MQPPDAGDAIARNAFCAPCGSWVHGAADERDHDGNLIRDAYGNRMRQLECGHVLHAEEPDLSLTVAEDEPW